MEDPVENKMIEELKNKLNEKFPDDAKIKFEPNGTARSKNMDGCIYTDRKSYNIISINDSEQSVKIGEATYGNNIKSKIVEGKLKIPLKNDLIGNFFKKISKFTPGPSNLTSLPRSFRFKVDHEYFDSIEDFNLDEPNYHT